MEKLTMEDKFKQLAEEAKSGTCHMKNFEGEDHEYTFECEGDCESGKKCKPFIEFSDDGSEIIGFGCKCK